MNEELFVSPRTLNVVFVLAIGVAVLFTTFSAIRLTSTGSDMNDNMTGGAGTAVSASRIIAQSPIGILYEHSIVALPAAWSAVIGILIWKGKTRSVWTRKGFNYDTFKLVAQMPGSPTRINLLQSLNLPKNKLQLARELGMDWQTIDDHMKMLERSGLVDELTRVGNSRYYIISERGKRILSLLADSDSKNSVTK